MMATLMSDCELPVAQECFILDSLFCVGLRIETYTGGSLSVIFEGFTNDKGWIVHGRLKHVRNMVEKKT